HALLQIFLNLLLRSRSGLQLLDGAGQLVRKHGKQPHAAADARLQAAIRAQSPASADELHTLSAFEPLDAGNRDHANRAGAAHVRAATGGHVEVFDLDDAEIA